MTAGKFSSCKSDASICSLDSFVKSVSTATNQLPLKNELPLVSLNEGEGDDEVCEGLTVSKNASTSETSLDREASYHSLAADKFAADKLPSELLQNKQNSTKGFETITNKQKESFKSSTGDDIDKYLTPHVKRTTPAGIGRNILRENMKEVRTTKSPSSVRSGKKRSSNLVTSYFSPLKRERTNTKTFDMTTSNDNSTDLGQQHKKHKTAVADEHMSSSTSDLTDNSFSLLVQCSKCGEEVSHTFNSIKVYVV